MRFYSKLHKHYCGVDIHAKTIYVCIIDQETRIIKQKNIKSNPAAFMKAIDKYRDDIVVSAECMFTWYWLADLCAKQNITFILGHALYMKAIHGGKAENDRIDAYKIAYLLRGGNIPMAYVYPPEMRATRDLMRRRNYLVRKRAELLGHIQNTNHQYNLSPLPKNIRYKVNREGLIEHFKDECVQKSMETNLFLIDHYNSLLLKLEHYIRKKAKVHDHEALLRLLSVPGIGQTLALVILYEIHDIRRFPRVQHLKWAFSEAAVSMLRRVPDVKKYKEKLQRKHGKANALGILAHKIGRATYYMLKRKEVFNIEKFLTKK
jgi:transposase